MDVPDVLGKWPAPQHRLENCTKGAPHLHEIALLDMHLLGWHLAILVGLQVLPLAATT